jgi:hypothetical protein
MKVTVKKTFILELEESLVEQLAALVGGVGWPSDDFVNLYHALREHMPECTTSYSDFFTGDVSFKIDFEPQVAEET